MHYTGIGSRETPTSIIKEMEKIGRMAAVLGHVLRSGHADGADMAFERGCDSRAGDKEIYIPWFRFNGSNSKLHHIPQWAYDEAGELHKNWKFLKAPVKKLHARNVLQVMGLFKGEPGIRSAYLVCWTPRGEDVGGTATALRLARYLDVPIINMFNEEWSEEIKKFVPNF